MTTYDNQRDEHVEDLDVTDAEAEAVKGGIIAVRKAGGTIVEPTETGSTSG